MDNQHHDQKFFVSFGLVMGALFVIFFICIFAARLLVGGDEGPDARELSMIEARIKPVGEAVTDPSVLLKAAASKPARAPYTADEVMAKVCGACHNAALLGAPKTGDKAGWAKRLSANGGLEGLVASAIKGKGANMPARGGDPDLSDAEVRAAVEFMLK